MGTAHRQVPRRRSEEPWETHLTGYAYETVAGKPIIAGKTEGNNSVNDRVSRKMNSARLSGWGSPELKQIALGTLALGAIPTGGGTYLQKAYGKEVPEAVRWVVAAGATLRDYKRFSASLRLRYFGPRPLTSDAIYTSPLTALVNLRASYKINEHWSRVGEVLNLLNRRDHDVDYAYVSQITPAAGLGLPTTPPTTVAGQEQVANAVNAEAAFTRVMHPVEPIEARFSLRFSFGR